MHLFSRNEFQIAQSTVANLNLTEQQGIDLDQLRRQMNGILGLEAAKWSVFGVSDLDIYFRVGNVWDYSFKCRRIDAGARIGVLIPSGITRNIRNPASIPFGGNGLWGIYGALDAELELKQDWLFGILVRLNQRFSKAREMRIPVAEEQPLYAAAIGNVEVEPGITAIFSPYLRFENLRAGLGFQGQYTLVAHDDDGLIDKRSNRTPPATFAKLLKKTDWIAEYVTVNAFYDFGLGSNYEFSIGSHCVAPIFSVKWDVPIKLFLADDAVKTHRLSIGLIFNF